MALLQSIVMFFSYFQNFSLTTDLKFVQIPESLKHFFQIFTKFLLVIINYLNKVPKFDIRIQLIFISLGIPFILDIIFNWFVLPFSKIINHILDLIVIIFTTINVVEGIILNFSKGNIIVIILGLVYLIFRVFLIIIKKFFSKRRKQRSRQTTLDIDENYNISDIEIAEKEDYLSKENVRKLIRIICDTYLATIIPDIQSKYDINDLEVIINSYSQIIQKNNYQKVDPTSNYVMLFFIFVFLLISVIFHPKLKKHIGMNISNTLTSIISYTCFVIACLEIFYYFFRKMKCGIKFLSKFRNFATHYGLQLLMCIIEILYIPVIRYLMINIIPIRYSCGTGYYLQYYRTKPINSNDFWFPFVNHSWTCLPCYPVLVSTRKECVKACSGKKEWRVKDTLNLLYFEDQLMSIGGIVLFIVFVYLIGIPVLWNIIINRNKSAIKCINSFGLNFYGKWDDVMYHLSTTGAYLFKNYSFNNCKWNIFQLSFKLLLMVFVTLSDNIHPKFIWGIVGLYIILIVGRFFSFPSKKCLQNLFDLFLNLFNLITSTIFFCQLYGLAISQNAYIIITIIHVILPFFLSIITLICDTYHDISNPTYIFPKKLKEIKKEIKKKKIKNTREFKFPKNDLPEPNKYFRLYLYEYEMGLRGMDDDENENNRVDLVNESRINDFGLKKDEPLKFINGIIINKENNKEYDKKALFIWDVKQDAKYPKYQDEDWTFIEERYFDSIERLAHIYKWDYVIDEYGNKTDKFYQFTPAFLVKRRVVYNRFQRMYKMIDVVLDALTIEYLTKALNWAMIFGAFAFGWYIGATLAKEKQLSNIFCG